MTTQTLAQVPIGRFVRIHRIESQPEVCRRLHELGFCENAVIRTLVCGDGNLICEVCNSRVGLNHEIASDILVSAFE
jgi:ferrous iron transport protein A